MLLVIFGAGASHGSGEPAGIHVSPPPLADELLRYREIAMRYPGSATVADRVGRAMIQDGLPLEDALAQFGILAERSTIRHQQLIAFRFYLCDVIRSTSDDWLRAIHTRTRYLTLLDHLFGWQEETGEEIQLATFNYDLLIEGALENVLPQWRFREYDDYINGRSWSLFKLHGSVNWCREISNPDLEGGTPNFERAIREANRFASPRDASLVIADPLAQELAAGSVRVPAVAVPMTGKSEFECPVAHVEALRRLMPEVKRVLICGWRAAEEHMIEILEWIPPGYRLGVVSGNQEDAMEVYRQLGKAGDRGSRVLFEPNGMGTLVENMDERLHQLLAPWN